MPEIRHMLVLSTQHLTPETVAWLEAGDLPGQTGIQDGTPSGGRGPFGWFVYAHDDNASYPSAPHAPKDEYPAELWACFRRARELGCDYIMFDSDAEPIEGLDVFDHQA